MIEIKVKRISDNEIVYGNMGGEEHTDAFLAIKEHYDNDPLYEVTYSDVTDREAVKALRPPHVEKVRNRLKKLKNIDLDSLTALQIRKILKAVLDLLVDRDELSDEEQ